MNPESREVLEQLRSRDADIRRRAELELMAEFEPRLRTILARVVDASILDDAVQEVFVDVLRGLDGFDGRSRISTWIYRVALRRGWKLQAREARRRAVEPSSEHVAELSRAARHDDLLEEREMAERFEVALKQLDFDQRSVLALTACRDLRPNEIAETLGIPVGTVHSRLSRARARLGSLLDLDA